MRTVSSSLPLASFVPSGDQATPKARGAGEFRTASNTRNPQHCRAALAGGRALRSLAVAAHLLV